MCLALFTQAHPDSVTADNGLNRILVRFDTARVHIVPRPAPPAHGEAGVGPSTTQRGTPAEDERCGWLARHGLQEHHPVGLKGKPTSFIDIQYLDDELRVHTGESGTVYGEWVYLYTPRLYPDQHTHQCHSPPHPHRTAAALTTNTQPSASHFHLLALLPNETCGRLSQAHRWPWLCSRATSVEPLAA